HPNPSFGEQRRFVLNTQAHLQDFINFSGVDCAPDGSSLILWHQWLYRYALADSSLTRLVKGEDANQLSAWSPDGTRIAYIDGTAPQKEHQIFTILTDGSAKSQITTSANIPTSLAWSPDGTRIAYTYVQGENLSQRGIQIVNPTNGAETTVYDTSTPSL